MASGGFAHPGGQTFWLGGVCKGRRAQGQAIVWQGRRGGASCDTDGGWDCLCILCLLVTATVLHFCRCAPWLTTRRYILATVAVGAHSDAVDKATNPQPKFSAGNF